ncbi:hypothetical protein AN958_05109 [Leucoagaricus sp. SymC.cos]|nr:hypothetical protein AN958_05109 [Leucoagaricus sp. SymC.cos]
MPSFFPSVARLLPSFITGNGLKEYSKRYPSCFFLRLPLLIYLDYVFPCLAVEDVICLRRVNKAFYLITHEPSIWRRFLSRMNHHPVIYLRPTFDYTNADTYYEAEQIVTRTISLDDNWRDSNPKVISRMLFETHYEVLDMSLLPGGKYLIASVKDKGSYRYYLTLYILDHPSGPRAICRVHTLAKVFRIQTRYMKINGEFGIAISCVRRRFNNGGPLNLNLSEFSHDHKIDVYPYFSEVLVYFISLPTLEYLGDPNLTWGSPEHKRRLEEQTKAPFRLCNQFEVKENDVQHVAMFDSGGEAWLAVVTRDNYISFLHVGQPGMIVLKCPEHAAFQLQPIRAVLPLPKQKQILVVRQCIAVDHEEWVVELYNFPTQHATMAPTHYVIVKSTIPKSLLKVHISDPQVPYHSEKFPKLLDEPLPPVSIYFESCQPYGLVHFCLWPMYQRVEDGKVNYIPRTAKKTYAIQTCHICEPQAAHVLPGGYRAIYYTTSHDDRRATPSMIKLRRYLSPEIQRVAYPLRPEDNSLAFLRKKRPVHPTGLYGTVEIPLEDSNAFSKGINAITWDETLGRICIAVEGELGVRILDMGRTVEPDSRFAAWRKKTDQEMFEQDCWHSKDCIHSESIPGWFDHWLG